jgi:uncharacterized membrane protein YdjX (TVP38/TMEM64 family)
VKLPIPLTRNLLKPLVFVVSVALLVLLSWYAEDKVSTEALANQENHIRELIALDPWRSFFIGFGMYFALALVPGTGGKAVVWGWLFGFWLALVTVSIGLTLAALVVFSLSRYLFRQRIERRYSSFLALLNRHLEKEGAFYLLTLRMTPVPFSIINPVSGASRVRFWTFFWTTVVGMLPPNAIWVYIGTRLPSLGELAAHGPGTLMNMPLLIALAACAVFPLLVRWLVSHFGIPAIGTKFRADTAPHSKGEQF